MNPSRYSRNPLEIVVHEWGPTEARPLVCVHGVTGHGPRFERLASRLEGFRVVAPDLRGHGSSVGTPPWDVEQHLADLVASVDVGPATWLGHSFGGRLVIELAVRRPDLVERAILLDPALRILPHVALDLAEADLAEVSFASVDEAIDARLASGRLLRTPRELLEEELPPFLEEGRDGRFRYRHSRPAVITAWSEMSRPVAELARIPTLLVVAEESWLVLDEDVDAYREALGDLLEVVRVPGGHVVLWDAFEETLEAVASFLSR